MASPTSGHLPATGLPTPASPQHQLSGHPSAGKQTPQSPHPRSPDAAQVEQIQRLDAGVLGTLAQHAEGAIATPGNATASLSASPTAIPWVEPAPIATRQSPNSRPQVSLSALRSPSAAIQRLDAGVLGTLARHAAGENGRSQTPEERTTAPIAATPPETAPGLPPPQPVTLQREPQAAEEKAERPPKLAIGQPGDPYEQAADRVASQVMAMPEPASPVPLQHQDAEAGQAETEEIQAQPLVSSLSLPLQRQGEEEEDGVRRAIAPMQQESTEPEGQAKGAACEQENQVQRWPNGTMPAQPALESRLKASQGEGSSLPDEARSFMEPRFGADFSQVRVHTGSAAVQMNRELNAQAFTQGSDIYYGSGKAPEKNDLTAHELTHIIQQNDGVGPFLQPFSMIQRDTKSNATNPQAEQPPAPRNEIDLISSRLKSRQIDLNTFLQASKNDIENIRNHFLFVNGVYQRCFNHYKLVISQANANIKSTQELVDFFFGIATGVAIGALAEATIAAKATQLGVELLAEAAAEGVEGGVGMLIKPELEKAKLLPDEFTPEFKKIQTLEMLDKLNKTLLEMAVPGTFVFTHPITQCERLSAELRVIEAGGKEQRRISDMEIREGYLKLMKFDLQSLKAESELKEAQIAFDKLRTVYYSRPPISDQQCEQDIWIHWLAEQDPLPKYGGFVSSIVKDKLITRHLIDIGLIGDDSPGGRLNAQAWVPHLIVQNAKVAASQLPTYWKKLFLYS